MGDAPRRAAVVAWLAVVALAAPFAAGQIVKDTKDPKNGKDPNQRCMQCHGQAHIAELDPAERRSMVGTWLDTETPQPPKPTPAGETPAGEEPPLRPGLYVQLGVFANGPHAPNKCIDCHEDAARLPHAPKLNRATCASTCHEAASTAYNGGSHHAAVLKGEPRAPTCVSCHGGHDILKVTDRKAPQHRLNSLFLCGDCHKQHGTNGDGIDGSKRISNYLASAHAKAVTQSGLLGAATCPDCHSAHGVRPSKDPESTVSRANVPNTCGKCHAGVLEKYATSVHGQKHANNDGKAAVCTDCHTAHEISRAINAPEFLRDVIDQCGQCHDSPDKDGKRVGTYYATYARSYHGQVSRLGASRAATCADCHGSHDILPLSDPGSRVNNQHLIQTCGRCHPGANASFVKFDPHANHRDAKNFPVLHGVWLYFMVMMSSVFTFFGLHTILWFLRSKIHHARHGREAHHGREPTAIRRFSVINRINHAFVAITFFGLTATGIPLVFAREQWARPLAGMFGGVEAAGLWHRFFAILLILNFALHFVAMAQAFLNRKCSWQEWLFGPNSLLPRWKDATDCFGMFKWFFGLGPRPKFDRWTYWEKFDYWAEVGGSMIIGGSGLLLWFPVLAARMVPGWTFNIAMIVHGYEALLAIGFIFTIHFFNAHVRPGVFPVDEVIFTGSLPEAELKEQRPEEYERLLASGQLEALRVPAPSRSRRPVNIAIAIVSVGVGIGLLILIIIGGLSRS